VSTHRILVAWHQLYLAPFDTSPQFVGAGAGTLVAVAEVPGHLIVRTGCATGPVRATLTVHSASPEVALDGGPGGTGPWEAVEEVSMPVTEPLFWFSPDPGLDLPTEAAFAPATPGPAPLPYQRPWPQPRLRPRHPRTGRGLPHPGVARTGPSRPERDPLGQVGIAREAVQGQGALRVHGTFAAARRALA
jgi:hypothetical protein